MLQSPFPPALGLASYIPHVDTDLSERTETFRCSTTIFKTKYHATHADVFREDIVAPRTFPDSGGCQLHVALLRHAPRQATQHNLPQTAGFYQARLSELCYNDFQHSKIISAHSSVRKKKTVPVFIGSSKQSEFSGPRGISAIWGNKRLYNQHLSTPNNQLLQNQNLLSLQNLLWCNWHDDRSSSASVSVNRLPWKEQLHVGATFFSWKQM